MNAKDPTPEDIENEGRLDEVREWLKSDFDRARDLETRSLDELEKSLWLSNAGAATVTIGYLTASNNPTYIQFLGCCMFVAAIISLMLMRIISATNASRDRYRRQSLSDRFFTENRPISSLAEIRDRTFHVLKFGYLSLKVLAASLFIAGCVFTLISFYPQLANS